MQVSKKQYNKFIDVLDDDETLYWIGKTNPFTYLFMNVIAIVFLCFWGACFIGMLWFMMSQIDNTSEAQPALWFLYGIAAIVTTALVFGFSKYSFVALFNYHNHAFAISNKRLLKRTGVFGNDYETIDFDQIDEVNVRKGPIEKQLGVATININGAEMTSFDDEVKGFCFESIAQPQAVYKLIRKVAFDVRTDWQYPNAIRPAENPGFHAPIQPEPYTTNPDWQQVNEILNKKTVQSTNQHIQPLSAQTNTAPSTYPLGLNNDTTQTSPSAQLPKQPQNPTPQTQAKSPTQDELQRMVLYDVSLISQFEDLLDNDEVVFWVGKPHIKVVLIYIAIILVLLALLSKILAIIIVTIMLHGYTHTFYAISNKRFLYKTNYLIGTDYKTIEYDKTTSIDAKVNPISKLFDKGSLSIRSKSGVAVLFSTINDPYEVERLAKIVALDIKTDVQFPNAMR